MRIPKANTMNRTDDFHLAEQRCWLAVALCLERFHGYDLSVAWDTVRDVQNSRAKELQSDPDLLYHEEPFYLACDISGKEFPLPKYRAEYEKVLAEAH
jgi:hypothetical protein